MTVIQETTRTSPLGWPGQQSTAPVAPTPAVRRNPWPVVALALLLIASLAIGVLQTVRLRERSDRLADEHAALAAAKMLALALDTYDFHDLDRSFDAVLAGATEPFRSQYASTSDKLKGLLQQYQAKATSSVVAAGVAGHTGDTITVVLFVDQTVTNANTPRPRLDRNRLQLTLRKVHGRFLVSDAQLL